MSFFIALESIFIALYKTLLLLSIVSPLIEVLIEWIFYFKFLLYFFEVLDKLLGAQLVDCNVDSLWASLSGLADMKSIFLALSGKLTENSAKFKKLN